MLCAVKTAVLLVTSSYGLTNMTAPLLSVSMAMTNKHRRWLELRSVNLVKTLGRGRAMQMFPLESQRSGIGTTRRVRGPDRSSPTKSPIDSPMKLLAKIKVLIIHHAPLVRSGLVALIEATGRFAVCGETDDAPRKSL